MKHGHKLLVARACADPMERLGTQRIVYAVLALHDADCAAPEAGDLDHPSAGR